MENFNNLFSFDYVAYYQSDQWKEKICKDEVIGYVNIKSNSCQFYRRSDYENVFLHAHDHDIYFKSKSTVITGKIALVLESPHIDEFNINNVHDFITGHTVYARPANSTTGINIDKYIIDVFNGLLSDLPSGCYSLSLFNSIQNQCSLGTDTKFYRDRIWTICWFEKNNYNNDFITRLNNFAPDVILNCATIGEHYKIINNSYATEEPSLSYTKKFLKTEFNNIQYSEKKANIQKIISESISSSAYFRDKIVMNSTHPSSWHYVKNRIMKSP